jgi:chromate transporter
LIVVLLLAFFYAQVADTLWARGALQGMGAVSAGLIAATGIKLIAALKENVMGMAVCIALAAMTFIAVAWLRLPLAWVLLGIGSLGFAWAYHRLGES